MDYIQLKKLMSEQKEEMSIQERAKYYKEGKEVDCIPYNIFSPDLAFANIYGFTVKQFNESIDVKAEVIRRKRKEYGINTFSVGLGLKKMGNAAGSTLHIPENSIEYVQNYVLEDYENIDSLEIVDPYSNPVLLHRLEEAKRLKERFEDLVVSTNVAGPFSTAVSMRPVEKVLRDTVKQPEKLNKLLSYTVECNLRWIEVFCREFGNVSVSFSDPVTSMDVLSKRQFEQFSKPYINKLIAGIEKITGKKPGAHICGHTKAIWSDLVEMGISNLSLDNNESLLEAKKCVGDKMGISGNVPPVDIMLRGTIDEVITACKKNILECADNPMGYTLSMGCQLPVGVPRRNIDAFVYAARKYGRAAKIGEMPEGIWEE